ncbi:MAG TPA: RNA 2',3'-cyclic phosphodiesterase [Candidatus Limnocylindrales bacterium]|nr:RNA 2',3'-cyclic phosphodiesterase [Candidatus Limnocylindrales bacterium]
MPESWRLFVAAPLPHEAATRVVSALEPLRAAFPETRWVSADKLHLTLVFLGQTDSARVPALTTAIDAVASRVTSFEVSTADGGGLPNGKRGGVAWLRLDGGGSGVAQLAIELDRDMGSGTYDDHRRPRPHLTVARRVDEAVLAALRELAPVIKVSWTLDRVVLLRSHTDPAGSRYEERHSTLLTADSPAA